MVSKKVLITCQYGLHMLPSVRISDRLSKYYSCNIRIHYKDKDINAKNVVDLMANYLKCGSEVTLVCDGEQEEEALNVFSDFIENELNELPHK
jgi:phosphocarrier protein